MFNFASAIRGALGLVSGIMIPGQSTHTVNLNHDVQQHFADLYGEAVRELAVQLKLDTTGMTEEQKVFRITDALVQTATRDGFKGDERVLAGTLRGVASAALRAAEPSIDSDIVMLAASLGANPIEKLAAGLVGKFVQHEADTHMAALELTTEEAIAPSPIPA